MNRSQALGTMYKMGSRSHTQKGAFLRRGGLVNTLGQWTCPVFAPDTNANKPHNRSVTQQRCGLSPPILRPFVSSNMKIYGRPLLSSSSPSSSSLSPNFSSNVVSRSAVNGLSRGWGRLCIINKVIKLYRGLKRCSQLWLWYDCAVTATATTVQHHATSRGFVFTIVTATVIDR